MSKVANLEERRKQIEYEKEVEKELCKLNTLRRINSILREHIERENLASPTSKT
jgi:hypothetical protein